MASASAKRLLMMVWLLLLCSADGSGCFGGPVRDAGPVCGALALDTFGMDPAVAGKGYLAKIGIGGGVPPYHGFQFCADTGGNNFAPLGLTLSPSGVLSGTVNAAAQSTTMCVQALDAANNPVTQHYYLAVQPAGTLAAARNIVVAPPNGKMCNGGAPALQLGARVGVVDAAAPHAFELAFASTQLPAGLQVDPSSGAVTGIAADGNYQALFTVAFAGGPPGAAAGVNLSFQGSSATGGNGNGATAFDGTYSAACAFQGQLGNGNYPATNITFQNGLAAGGQLHGTVSSSGAMALDFLDSCNVSFQVSGPASAAAGARFQLQGDNGNDPSCTVLNITCTMTRQ